MEEKGSTYDYGTINLDAENLDILQVKKNRGAAAVDYAIKTGRLARPDRCSKCGEKGFIDAHHENYDKPLEVMWLCRSCHKLHHQAKREAYRLAENGTDTD